MNRIVLIAAICIYVLTGQCCAQILQSDTTAYLKIQQQAVNYFNSRIWAQSEVYNGAVYTLYPSGNKGTFYFQDKNSVTPARIVYNGTLYNNAPVIYDVYHDQMVSFADGQLFILVPENLSDVYIEGHHFIRATVDANPGYYEELYDGKSQVLLKYIKVIEEHIIPPQTAENWYLDKKQLYIKSNDRYILITGKGTMLKAFGTKRKEIERYLDDNKFNFSTQPESTTVKAAAYFDRLNP